MREQPTTDLIDAALLEYEAAHPVFAAKQLTEPHPITLAAACRLEVGRPDDYGAVHARSLETFAIRVHPTSTDRVLRIVDAFAKACEARGFGFHPQDMSQSYLPSLGIVIDGQSFGILFNERMSRRPYQPTKAESRRKERGLYLRVPAYSYQPSGELSLEIVGRSGPLKSIWKDVRPKPMLEAQFNDVMIGLRSLVQWRKAERQKEEERETRRRLIQQQRDELRQRIEDEQEAVDDLEADAHAWRRAQTIRAYLAARRAAIPQDQHAKLSEWFTWAYQQADRLDPLCESPPSILDTPESDVRVLDLWESLED